jgi:hypothetical protein
MNKMLRYSFMLLLGFTALLSGCTEVEPTDPNQKLLANKEWYTDGLYFNVAADGTGGNRVIAPNLRLKFSKTSSVNTTSVNGQSLGAAAIWILSADAKTLTVYYPTVASGGVSVASQALKVAKLTETELWVTTPSADDIQLFGIINLSATSNYRFTTTKPADVVPLSEEALLKGVTWTGKGNNAGFFLNGNKQTDADVSFAFKTFSAMNLNYLEVSGLTAPATWVLSKEGSNLKITIAYPKLGSIPAKAFVLSVSKLDADELNFTSNQAFDILPTLQLPLNQELRMIPK